MTATYNNEDLVYVNPETREVVGLLQWNQDGTSKVLEMKEQKVIQDDTEEDNGKRKRGKRHRRKRYYPWGTYLTMKKLYKIEGKHREVENYKELDDAISLAMKEPFWD